MANRIQKKFSVGHPVKNSLIQKIVKTTSSQIEKNGYYILPSTQAEIKTWIRKAVRNGLLINKDEVKTATVALVSGAVTAAKESRGKRITTRHLSIGWKRHIKDEEIGNCPPHECLLRSTVQRKNDLLKSNTIFNKLLDDIEKEI